MIVVAALIVMGVNHSEMTGKFMDEVVHVRGEERMSRVETRADFGGVDTIEDPQDVARVAKEQMRQFVLEHAHNAKLFAAVGYLVQRFDDMLHTRQLFLRGNSGGIFRTRME